MGAQGLFLVPTLRHLGLTIQDIDLGEFDAESDYKLEQDFVPTIVAERALRGRGHIFLGRKGSGKSALFRHLPYLSRAAGGPTVLQVTPEDYALAVLKAYKEQGLAAEQAHASTWKLTLSVEIAARIVGLGRDWTADARRSIYVLKDFIEANYGEIKIGDLSTSRPLYKGIESFNLTAFGIGVGLSKAAAQADRPITPAVIDLVLKHLSVPLTENPVLVAIDRLDDAWDGSEDTRSLLIGLLKAAKDLNDYFRRPDAAPNARLLVFLRTDIYDALEFDDKDKHRRYEEQISWAPDGLRDLVTRRLPHSLTVDELFADATIGRTRLFEYLLSRTFMRPREVLQFVDLCLRHAGERSTEILAADVRAAEGKFSRWKVEDLKQEYVKALPDFPGLLEALRQQSHRYASFDELLGIIERSAPAAYESLGPRGCLEMLFDTSVIGIRVGGAGRIRYLCTDADLSLPTSGAVYVHPALSVELGLAHRRASGVPSGPSTAGGDTSK